MLKFNEWAGLQSGNLFAIHNDLACLTYKHGMFIMSGPSGVHTLHGETTDFDRLNAHWVSFCADSRNKFSSPMVKESDLIRDAFFEGFQAGRDGGWIDGGTSAWSVSDAKRDMK